MLDSLFGECKGLPGLAAQSTTQGRTVLQRILRGRLTFTSRLNPLSGEPDGYDFDGLTRFDRLFAGIAVECPTGLTLGDTAGYGTIGPEDTFDGDYGRMLDRIHVKGMASPPGTEDLYTLVGSALKAVVAAERLEPTSQWWASCCGASRDQRGLLFSAALLADGGDQLVDLRWLPCV